MTIRSASDYWQEAEPRKPKGAYDDPKVQAAIAEETAAAIAEQPFPDDDAESAGDDTDGDNAAS